MERCTLVTVGALGALVSAVGCVDISGGAVELSWSFQTFVGGSIQDACATTQVESVRLCWRAKGGENGTNNCQVLTSYDDFPCNDFRGITDFVIPPGEQLMEIAPLCTGQDQPPERQKYDVPAPIVRDVITGEVVTLDSLLIVINEADADGCACCDPETMTMADAPTTAMGASHRPPALTRSP